MKFRNKKAIFFDLDGTLIDSAPDLAVAINFMLSELRRPTFTQKIIRSWIGNGVTVLVKRALSGNDSVDENLDEALFKHAQKLFLNYYKEHLCVKTQCYAGVCASLKVLKAQGYSLVVITNKPFEFIQPIIDELELNGLFELLLGGDSLEKRKPDALPLLHACKALNVSVQQCVMVGDSKNDILAANAADMQSIGLTYGYNYGEDIGLHKPYFVFDHFSDIVATFSPVSDL